MYLEFSPGSVIKILRDVPLDNTYKDTLTFGSKADQTAYFSAKAKFTYSNTTYQRINTTVKVQFTVDDLYDCNYIMFQNSNYGTKWFYAFIVNYEYINANTTEIQFEIDAMQTWAFDYTVHPSFVSREHIQVDSIGANLVPENLETGEYVVNGYTSGGVSGNNWIIVGFSDDLVGGANPSGVVTGIYQATNYYGFSKGNAKALNSLIDQYSLAGKGDAIVCVFMYPKAFIPNASDGGPIRASANPTELTATGPVRSLNGYTPRNNKLWTYPYCFMEGSTNSGSATIYRYEYFNGLQFSIMGTVEPAATAVCVPRNYKGLNYNWDETIQLTGWPMCSWKNRTYENWIAQHSATRQVQALGAVGKIASGALTMNPNGIVGGLEQIANLAASVTDHAVIPDSARGNAGGGSALAAFNVLDFYFYSKSITAQFAQRIDQFFDMFGYQTNLVKIPNITGRASWNFVQTVDAKITGSIPVPMMSTIKANFNRGITFWHGDWVGDYTRDNSPV